MDILHIMMMMDFIDQHRLHTTVPFIWAGCSDGVAMTQIIGVFDHFMRFVANSFAVCVDCCGRLMAFGQLAQAIFECGIFASFHFEHGLHVDELFCIQCSAI